MTNSSSGYLVAQQQVANTMEKIDVKRLAAGLYIMSIIGIDGNSQQIKFMKE